MTTAIALGHAAGPTSATGTGWERTPWHATSAGGVEGFETGRRSSGMLVVTRREGRPCRCLEAWRPEPSAALTGRYERLTITQ
jgi:hypothetical protein